MEEERLEIEKEIEKEKKKDSVSEDRGAVFAAATRRCKEYT